MPTWVSHSNKRCSAYSYPISIGDCSFSCHHIDLNEAKERCENTPECDGVNTSVNRWSGRTNIRFMNRSGVDTAYRSRTTCHIIDRSGADCEGEWSDCTNLCERTWVQSVAPEGDGDTCPDISEAPECQAGDGECPQSINCEGSWDGECDSNCEKTWVQSVAPNITGEACPEDGCQAGDGECPQPINCEGSFQECTSQCETASQRIWNQTVAPNASGEQCPEPTDCSLGDGLCMGNFYKDLNENVRCHRYAYNNDRILRINDTKRNRANQQYLYSSGNLAYSLSEVLQICENNENCTAVTKRPDNRWYFLKEPYDPTPYTEAGAICYRKWRGECVREFAECTSDCETSDERTFTEIFSQEGNGASCPATPSCELGDGDCLGGYIAFEGRTCNIDSSNQTTTRTRLYNTTSIRWVFNSCDNDPECNAIYLNGTGTEYSYYLKNPELVGESNDPLNCQADLKI